MGGLCPHTSLHTHRLAHMHPYTPTHPLCVIAPPGQRPHYRDRFQSCPILACVGSQTKPWHGVTLTKHWNYKSQNCRGEMEKSGKRLEIYECEQGVLAVWDITDLACAGRMELLSIIFIYPHLHTERLRCRFLHSLEDSGLSLATKLVQRKTGHHWLFVQTDNTMFTLSFKA